MMRSVIASSLKFRRLVVAVAAGMLVFGVVQLRHTPVDQLPEFGPTMVEVRTEALGLSAVEVEQLITVPLEQDLLNGIPFLQDIYSESVPGLSSVVMIFEPGTPLLDARQVVAEKVAEAAVALPGVSTPPQMLQPLSSTSRVLTARLSSETVSAIDMSVLARWVIGPGLLGVEGVSNVSIWGQRDRQLQVLVDPERLAEADVTLQEIVATTGNSLWVSPLTFLEASTPGTAGFIDTPNQRLGIRHELPIRTAEDLAQVPLEDEEGNAVLVEGEPVRLGDVTDVVENHQPLIGDAIFADGGGLLLVVEKFPGASTAEVTRAVEDAFEAMRPGLEGIEIDTSFFRAADYVETATGNLGTALLIGAILLLIALALLFSEWRQTVIVASAVLASAVTAGLVMYALDAHVNMLVLAGLLTALIIVVDDAVNDARNLAARLRTHREQDTGMPGWRIVLDACAEMRGSMLYATLIVLAAIVPTLFLSGPVSEFLPAATLSVALAVVVSMVVALTLTPALAMMLLPSVPSERRGSPVIRAIGAAYERAFSPPARGRAALGVAAVVVVAALVTVPFLDASSDVRVKESDLLIQWDAAPGTSLPAMNQVTGDAVAELSALEGVREVSAHVGRAVNSDQVVNVNSGQIWVRLDPAADHDATVASIRGVLTGYADMSHDVLTYPEARIEDVLRGTDEDVVVRLYGANPDDLETKAEEVQTLLSQIEGLGRPTIETTPTEPNIEVQVDLERAERFAVKPGDVRRASAILLSGLAAGNLFEEQKVFDVVVWGTPEIREDVSDVEQLLIDTPDGRHVRLGQVADVSVAPNPTVIRHESVSNYLDVSAEITNGDAGAVIDAVERAVASVEFPLEHHAEVLGSYGTEQAARSRILAVLAAAAITIFLLLQAAFASWRLAIVVFALLPLALAGGLIGTLLIGGDLTIGSALGFIAVLGFAVRHNVRLVRRFQQLERFDGQPFGPELVLDGTREQLATIATTAIATFAAMLPLVLAGDIAGMEIVRPMAAVVLGGSLTSAMVAVFMVPALYLRYGSTDRIEEDVLVVLPEGEAAVEPAPTSGS